MRIGTCRGTHGLLLTLALSIGFGCSGGARSAETSTAPGALPPSAPQSLAADNSMVLIPAGEFVAGSTPEEREVAYSDYLATAGHDRARQHGWFEKEADRHRVKLPAYRIDLMPVTQSAYAEFIVATARPAPFIGETDWTAQGFAQRYATEVARFNWEGSSPPATRADHPVVLVTHADAAAYCSWRGAVVGATRRLPTADELERAFRGDDGLAYPWGNDYDAALLNSAVKGPRDTLPVGTYPDGKSPHGVLDCAGNVFQWTSTPWPHKAAAMTVKGSAWDDFGGLGRGAAAHGRPVRARHVIVGFRCAADGQ